MVLTQQGEAMYMQSSSEIQRVALSACHCLQIKCHVPLLNQKSQADAAGDPSGVNENKDKGMKPTTVLANLVTYSLFVVWSKV